jgi:hypothetical protein
MIDLCSNLEQSSEVVQLIRKFPTTAFVAGRLQAVGLESDYGKSVLNHFSEELLRECGDEITEVLEHFRLVSFKPPSRQV